MKRLILAAALLFSSPAWAEFNGPEYFAFKNFTTTQATFILRGGNYGVTVHAGTWNSASVALQRQAADGSTMVTVVTAFSADGYASANLPNGTYQLTVTGSPTGVYADVTAIVTAN